MTSVELTTELNNYLGTVEQERNEYMAGLKQLAKQFKAAKKDLVKMLKKETSKTKRKTNLLLILTPYIIRDPGDLREIFERKMQERQQMIDRYFVFGEDKFEPHIDYSRTRGLVAEIVNEIDGVEEEIMLARAAELEPPPDHVPRAPVGSYRAGLPEEEEETFVIGPSGEEVEVVEPEQPAAVPPTAADEQEGGGAPPPPIEEPGHGAEPEAPPEPVTPTEPETPEGPDSPEGPEEVIEPAEPIEEDPQPIEQEPTSPQE